MYGTAQRQFDTHWLYTQRTCIFAFHMHLHVQVCTPAKVTGNNMITSPPSTIDQFHRSLKEFNKNLIAITSSLDAAVASISVLCSMENQWYAAFKLLPRINYTGYTNFANNIGKAIIFRVP